MMSKGMEDTAVSMGLPFKDSHSSWGRQYMDQSDHIDHSLV